MFERPIDIGSMFKELKLIQKKYGIPKSMVFVPNKLKIELERKESDKFEITYTEFFNYLPYHVLPLARECAIQFIQQLGMPKENISEMENGISLKLSGNFNMVMFTLIELFLQNKNIESELKSYLDFLYHYYEMLFDFFDLHWNFDETIENKFNNLINIVSNIIRENPSYISELEAIIKKYTSKNYEDI